MPRGRGGGGGGGGDSHSRNTPNPNTVASRGFDAAQLVHVDAPEGAVECLICADPVRAFCVFSCGHHTCYSCGLRIHAINDGGCPVCRVKGGEPPIITRAIGQDEEQYSAEEMTAMRRLAITDRQLKCVIDGESLASEVAKLYEFLCPMEACWRQGQQDPFFEFASLRDHLRIDHKLAYCQICVEHRSAFLCEQIVYGEEALQQHLSGQCPYDSASFTGHPPCKFCSKKDNTVRFYDGEALLSHMQRNHFTCDVCNKGQYTFTFYDNRNKLNQHFERAHKICDHPDCQSLDLMLRVFANDFDLAIHRQRVHGVKAKLVLNQSSFAHSGAESSAHGGGTGGGGGAGVPATGSNTNVIQITFDHIFRRETVEMLPTKTSASNRQRNRQHKHGSTGGVKEMVFAPLESGLPPHYHRAGVMDILIFPEGQANAASTATPASVGSTSRSSQQKQLQRHADPSSPNASGPATHAFGISESIESYNVKNKVPGDPREQERQLNELLSRALTSPVAYAHFRGYTKEFIESKLLTSQYYDLLAQEIFPDKTVFREVFPLLVATVPNANKKMALQEVWKMRMAPERQRLSRALEEDERAKEEAAEKERQLALWRELKSGGANKAKGKKSQNAGKPNAWMNAGKVSGLQSGASPMSHGPASGSTSPTPQATAPASSSNWAAHAGATVSPTSAAKAGGVSSPSVGSVWGGASAPHGSSAPATTSSTPFTSAPLGETLASNELFPTLPSNAARGGSGWGGSRKKAPPKANAWFQNR